MPLSHSYQATPIGSISLLPEGNRLKYIEFFHRTPRKLRGMLSSPHTGSYIRGLGKSYDIATDSCPKIAQAIFFIAIGEKTIAQLPAILSTELALPNDKAQKMAAEIEKDVFSSIKTELDEFLRKQKTSANSITSKIGMIAPKASAPIKNVLNLKELTPPKSAGQLPPRPPRFPLPPTSRTGQGKENGIKTPPPPIRFT